ncbi:SH3 domain-containing protein, partial [Brevibacillus formosus]
PKLSPAAEAAMRGLSLPKLSPAAEAAMRGLSLPKLSPAAEAAMRGLSLPKLSPLKYIQLGNRLTDLTQSVVKALNLDFVQSILSEDRFNYELVSLVYEDSSIVDGYKETDTSERQYSKQEIKEIVQEAIQESMIPGALLNIQSLLQSMYQALLKKGNPILAAILIGLLTSIIYDNVVKPTIEYHVKNTVTSTSAPKEAVKEINKETTKKLGVDATFIKGYKFVSAATLQVQERAARQSKRIHELKLGQVVQVIRSRKDWVLIEWNYSEEVKGRGWVYSRYLKAFN